jgi:hypothetical protein
MAQAVPANQKQAHRPGRNVNCIPTGFWRASGGLLESLPEPPVTGRPSDLFRRALMDIAIPD